MNKTMAIASPKRMLYKHDKRAKDKVRKSGGSAMRKAIQLGEEARVFSAVVHFNPTYGRLDGAVYVPEGESIPDVNAFLLELLNGLHGNSRSRDPQQRAKTRHQDPQGRQDGSATPHDEIIVGIGSTEIAAAQAESSKEADADADVSNNIPVDSNSADCVAF
ncbi:uncharacterized protein CTRU02_215407 [Colletotrichum truncatum]|uniref:Uncharacterized protein n=1 Tax=Colletotrichum truncatum TaxID=5467 RepID=A0ACC3YCC7_COLTU